MSFLITTTGLQSPISFDDLGGRTFVHPTVNYDLQSEYTLNELKESVDLANAIDSGYITATLDGVEVTSSTDLTTNFVLSTDNRLYTENVLIVKKNPGVGEFSSINDALNSITGNTSTNRFVVWVGPGEFFEPEMTIPQYCSIKGSSIDSTIVKPAGNHNLFNLTESEVEISFMNISSVPYPYAGIYVNDCGYYAQAHKVTFDNCYIGVLILSDIQDTYFYGEYVDYNGYYTYGTKILSLNGNIAYANLENYYNFISGPTNTGETVYGTYIEGQGSECHMLSGSQENLGINDAVGIYISDGALLEMSATIISNFNIGIHVPNIGNNTTLNIASSIIRNSITNDVLVELASATGSIGGTFDMSKVEIDSSNININIQDVTNGSLNISNKLNIRFNDTALTDVSTLIVESSTMGVLQGGDITSTGGLNIGVTTGFGYLEIEPNILKRYDWASGSLALPANSNRYVYINSSGVLTSGAAFPDISHNILLGRVVTDSTDIILIDDSPADSDHTVNKFSVAFREAIGPVFASGSIVTENVTPYHLNVSAGNYFYAENKYMPTGGTDITFTSIYRDGLGGYILNSTNVVDDLYYDDNSGTLAAITPGNYTKHSLYLIGEGINEKYFLVYSQNQYTSLLEAQEADIPSPPTYLSGSVVLIAGIIIQSGVTGVGNIIQIRDLRPVIGFRSEGVNASADHGSLLGLTDDDHPQYLLANGSRSLTGNLDLDSNNIINVSQINGLLPSDFIKSGGNSFGSNTSIGLTDSFNFNIRTNNLNRIIVASTGEITISNLSGTGSRLVTANATGQLVSASAITANRALASNASGIPTHTAVTDTELGYLSGVTSLIQTQLNNKQNLDSTLTSLAAYNTNGFLVQTAADTFTGRSLTQPAAGITIANNDGVSGNPTFALANDLLALESLASTGISVRTAADTWTTRSIAGTTDRITLSNADGVSGNPTIDISASYVGQTSITTLGTITTGTWNGTTIAIANGGTGQTNKTDAYDALSPNSTKGDITVHNGSDNVRLPVGTNEYALVADSAQSTGVKWAPRYQLLSVNTADSTTLTGTGVQDFSLSYTLPANTITTIGQTLRIRGTGIYSTDASPGTVTVRFRNGANVLFTTPARSGAPSQTNNGFDWEVILVFRTVGAGGTLSGYMETLWSKGSFADGIIVASNGSKSFDTTINQSFVFDINFSSNGNSIIMENFIVEKLN